jgi:hypothetical protein
VKYKLLDTGKGVLAKRSCEIVTSTVSLSFENALPGANAFFACAGSVYYRPIVNGSCTIESSKLSGNVKVGVVRTDARGSLYKWDCEGLVIIRKEGKVFVIPDDTELHETVAQLLLENQELRDNDKKLSDRVEKLEKEFERYFEGYDIL